MAIEQKGGTPRESEGAKVRKILDSAIAGGVIDGKLSVRDVVNRLGPSIEEIAGYVLAWERYVLVVARRFDDVVTNPAGQG